MNDDTTPETNDNAAGLPPGGARKRPPPTIELAASDVTDHTAAEDKTTSSSDKPVASWRSRLKAVSSRFARVKAAPAEPAEPLPARAGFLTSIIVSALSGALAAAIVAAVWIASQSSGASQDEQQIAALNNRINELEAKTAAPRADTSANRLTAAETALTGLRKDIADLRKQSDATAAALQTATANSGEKSAPDLSAIEERLSKLEQASVSQAAAQAAPVPADDSAVRLALVASALDQAVNRGGPFLTELASATKLSGDTPSLKLLAPFAAAGVPTPQTLGRDLIAQLPKLEAAPEPLPGSASLMDRLRASASSLVRVTRVDSNGADRASVLQRAKAAAQRDDLAEAKRCVTALPEQDRASLQGWIEKVDARDGALAASRQYVQDATTALPKPAAPSDSH